MLVVLLELFDAVARHLLFGRRNRAVRMRAEQDAPQAFAGQKAGRGALDAQALDELAPLAFEFVLGKRSLLREFGDKPQEIVRKVHKPGERNHAGVRAGAGRKIRAHPPQVLLDLAAGALLRARAGHCSGHVGQARRLRGRDGVAASKEKLSGKFRDRVRFHENDFETVRKRLVHAWRPDHRPSGSERGNRRRCFRTRRGSHQAAPFFAGWRMAMERL